MAAPGDIIFNTFTIGQFNLLDPTQGMINYFDLYEDILRPVFMAEVEVLDYNDALGTYMINGKEQVNISFTIPGDGAATVTLQMALFKNKHLDDKTFKMSGSMKYKTYKLRMVSQDLLNNQSTMLAKSFNQSTDQTVMQSLQTITQAQILTPDPCKGTQRLIAGNEKVYDFLNKIWDRHVSQQYQSDLYALFPSRSDGQESRTFCTFEYLMSQQSVFTLMQDPTIAGRTTTESNSMNNMLWLKVPDSFNTPITYNSPSNRSTYNVLVGKQQSNTIQANTVSGVTLGQTATGSYLQTINNSTTPPMRTTNIHPDNDVTKTSISDAKVARANYIKDLAQNSVKFEINGNPNIALGNIVTLNIPKKADADQELGENQMNDKVLIVRIRHRVKPIGTSPRYTMIIEAIKAGYYQSGA